MLDGDTVSYGGAADLRETLEYDLSQERNFRFNGLTMDETIHHLAVFISRLWQIHVFGEGNTRTTAVFFIKYLRMLGFQAENDLFAENSWYFRNALVRANYNNLQKGIHENPEFLEKFFRNLMLGEHNELKNRFLHIRAKDFLEIKENDKNVTANYGKVTANNENDTRNVKKVSVNDKNVTRNVTVNSENISVNNKNITVKLTQTQKRLQSSA